MWWIIFDYNPELIYALNIPPGQVVRIPVGPVVPHGSLLQ